MIPKIRIDKARHVPAYRQVADAFAAMIREGKVKPGERLPPERDLAEELGLARGTIKKAYEVLARIKMVETAQGRGTFAGSLQETPGQGRKERASRLIGILLSELEALRFSHREIRNLVDISILERQERIDRFHVAAVDCNPEALDMFRKQLVFIARLELKKFLLHELPAAPGPEVRLRDFELILCTSTHYADLVRLAPSLRERMVQVVAAPSQRTVLDLAGMGGNAKIGILCESRKFMEIIRKKLSEYGISESRIGHLLLEEDGDVAGFIGDRNIIIAPPGYSFEISRENKALIQRFTETGGRLVSFDYRIEQGSLLHLEERIKSLLERPREAAE